VCSACKQCNSNEFTVSACDGTLATQPAVLIVYISQEPMMCSAHGALLALVPKARMKSTRARLTATVSVCHVPLALSALTAKYERAPLGHTKRRQDRVGASHAGPDISARCESFLYLVDGFETRAERAENLALQMQWRSLTRWHSVSSVPTVLKVTPHDPTVWYLHSLFLTSHHFVHRTSTSVSASFTAASPTSTV
jgi:hypothetical protein